MSIHEAYNKVVEEAVSGRMVSPRGLTTFEVIGPIILKSHDNLTVARTKLNTKLAIVEALMMVSGEFHLDAIEKAAPNAKLDLYRKQSDYGPRIRGQMPRVIQLLRDDRWTRRAVAYFNAMPHWQTDDLACTTAMHWMIRNDTLETNVHVRSWDLAYGLPMDLMMFGITSQIVARCLNVAGGHLFVSADSAHTYADTMHLAKAEEDLEFILGPSWPAAGNEWHAYALRAKHAIQEFRTYGVLNPGVIKTKKV